MFSIDLFLKSLVLLSEFFTFSDHAIDFFFGKATLVVGDGDALLLASSFLVSGYSED
jgi:hypothetical protein